MPKRKFTASSPAWQCSPRCAGAVRGVFWRWCRAALWRPACGRRPSSCSAGSSAAPRPGRSCLPAGRHARLGRIAARGGDTVTVTDTGALIINGSTVAEPDITTPTQPVEGGPTTPSPRGGRAFPAVRCPHHGGRTAASTAPSHPAASAGHGPGRSGRSGLQTRCNPPQRKQHKSILEERNHL